MAIVALAVVTFLFDNLREKTSVPQTKYLGIACFKNSHGTPVENHWCRPVLKRRFIIANALLSVQLLNE